MLEHFYFTVDITSSIEGGFYFHPSDEDLSPGTPERKKPLSVQVSVKSRSENAVAGSTEAGSARAYKTFTGNPQVPSRN
jgi:hypothetical protein